MVWRISVKKINKAAVQIAKKAAGKDTFILGTIGGIHGSQTSDWNKGRNQAKL